MLSCHCISGTPVLPVATMLTVDEVLQRYSGQLTDSGQSASTGGVPAV
jgi:hypothetical protein